MVITDEGAKVILQRRALAMSFVGCVVPVSCVAGSCVCLPGAALGKGTVCTQNVSTVSGQGGAQILTLHLASM